MKGLSRTLGEISEGKYRLFAKTGPVWYKKPDGTFDDIDLTFNDTTSTIGDISLMNKGIVSVGKRKGSNPNKIVGIRPDNCQTGEKQLEFSLVNVELDGESQDFNVETDLELKLEASKVFQLVKLNKSFSNCKIEFDIHANGIELQNEKYTENTTICDYNFDISNLGQIEGGNSSNTRDNFYIERNTDLPYFDFYISQITNDYITTGELSVNEEFGNNDLSGYTIDDDLYSVGSSFYYKDCIILAVKAYNILDFENIIVNQLCDLYGLETIFENNEHGQYFIKNNKKVGSYFKASHNSMYVVFNTKEIPDNIKSLFIRKTFDSTSFLDLDLNTFSSNLSDRFDKNLKIEVNSNYYSGNDFEFKVSKESLFIVNPIAFDKDYNILDYKTTHTLKDNEDGTYRYTKYLLPETALNINSAKYLDTALYVSHTDDGWIQYNTGGGVTGINKQEGSFDTRRAQTSNSNISWQSATSGTAPSACGDSSVTNVSTGYVTITSRNYVNYQTHFHFDTSLIASVSDADFKFKGAYRDDRGIDSGSASDTDISVIFLKSTWDGVIGTGGATIESKWNGFTGITSGWGASDVTEYSAEFVIDGQSGNTTVGMPDETCPLNSDAQTDLANNNEFAMAVIDYDEYYSDSYDSSYGTSVPANQTEARLAYMRQVDDSTVAARPYIDFTGTTSSAVTYNATFFGTNF